eukprot:354742-Chlamydomonas_euryale.AAC.4
MAFDTALWPGGQMAQARDQPHGLEGRQICFAVCLTDRDAEAKHVFSDVEKQNVAAATVRSQSNIMPRNRQE